VSNEWVVLELGPKADGEDPDLVRRSIRGILRDADVFIPAAVTILGEDKVVRYLVEGYAFVRRTFPDAQYLKLENTRFVNAVLTRTGKPGQGRALSTIKDREIERLRAQVHAESEQGIGVGDTVLITSGPYRQITAIVYEDIPEHDAVQVFVRLRSKEALVSLPRNFLRLVSKAEKGVQPKMRGEELMAWLQGARRVFTWKGETIKVVTNLCEKVTVLSDYTERLPPLLASVQASYFQPKNLSELDSKIENLATLALISERLTLLVNAAKISYKELDASGLQQKASLWGQVEGWSSATRGLSNLLSPFYRAPSLARVESKYLDWTWACNALERLENIQGGIEVIQEDMADLGVEEVSFDDTPKTHVRASVFNVIIDGLNLAVRCMYAPGLGGLKDSKGRATGVYVGFLRSLGAFRKKWPGCEIYVCWDGSNNRRRAIFNKYKADRPPLPVSISEVEWLKEVLPLLGVHQYWHPDEEADDAIASLVSGPLADQRNIIYSTDKDLFQLVNERTSFLSPAVAKNPEKIYGVKETEERWGVPADKVTILRAFLGDTSDKIPGVGVTEAIVVKLVQAYGTVDRIFEALPTLPGLSKKHYEKLTTTEADVRRNLRLMTLSRDLTLTSIPARSDWKAAKERLLDVDMKPDAILSDLGGTSNTAVSGA
jgi:5'-3' exonuclease/transcription antitermination factor NusG